MDDKLVSIGEPENRGAGEKDRTFIARGPAPRLSESPTPLMQQYQSLKARYPTEILLFRLGDFYELFDEDARKCAPILELTLTHRQQTAMCGVPAHAIEPYIAKLLKAGLRVAIADQLEEPGAAKGIVKRDVVRVLTAGTLQEDALLPSRQCNYLAALVLRPTGAGLAAIECSTGEFRATQMAADASASALWDEIMRLSPSEIVIEANADEAFVEKLARKGIAFVRAPSSDFSGPMAEERLKKLFGTVSLRGYGLEGKPLALMAAGAALQYVESTQCGKPFTLQALHTYSLEETLQLDASTIDHLDLLPTAQTTGRPSTLLEILDHTLTAMGGRLLRRWVIGPLRDLALIRSRQTFVEFFSEGKEDRRELRALLRGCPDFERILTRLTGGSLSPRDLAGLGVGLRRVLQIRARLRDAERRGSSLGTNLFPVLSQFIAQFPEDTALAGLLEKALIEAPPSTMKEGGVIRDAYNSELDEVRSWVLDGKTKLLAMEKQEREKTGIGSLKIGYNNVFGYYLEVTRTHLARVPAHYHRKQTTANGERYITPELKEFEQRILGAEERAIRLEQALVNELREKILARAALLREISRFVAELDVYLSLAEVAERHHYVKPHVEDSAVLSIRDGRHPVLAEVLPAGTLVGNDTELNNASRKIIILTGPNMSGKSTYLRQTALIVILAQMGSFVPAAEARIGVVDHLFTRIGASDRLSEGESTFMVEMVETARILNHATPRSLVILDEVGRGTSTYDGISIAWACLEFLFEKGPKVLFATHYFEITELAQKLNGVRNAHVTAKEWDDEVIFLHKVEEGPADRAYGIHVARLAGVPREVIVRADALLKEFETKIPTQPSTIEPRQPLLFDGDEVPLKREAHARKAGVENDRLLAEALQTLELNHLTPVQALMTLHEWKQRFKAIKESGL